MKRLFSLLIALVGAVALDLLVKALAERLLTWHVPREVLGGWFRLTLGYNKGVAFGLFATDGPGVIIVSGLVTLLLAAWLLYALRTDSLRTNSHPLPAPWALGLLLGGAVANFADRLADGRVTDFIDFGIGTYRWPTFNLADVLIMVGAGMLLLASYRARPSSDPSLPGGNAGGDATAGEQRASE